MRFLPLSLLCAAVALGGCFCDPDVVTVAPQIAVDVCKTPQRVVRGKNVGGTQDCDIDFKTKDLSVLAEFQVKITNVTAIPLAIESVEVSGDPAFRIVSAPDVVGAGLTATMIVGFRPSVESAVEGLIKIDSDGENVEKGIVVIHLHGVGVDNGTPEIKVSSPDCGQGVDPNLGLGFGRVAQDGSARCTLTIENHGNRELVLDGVIMDRDTLSMPSGEDADAEPFVFVGRAPQPDDLIGFEAPNNAAPLTITFSPKELGAYAQTLVVLSNDPDRPRVEVPLTGEGVTPPSCTSGIESVNGQPYTTDTQIEPLDDVVLTADGSEPSTDDGRIVRVEWEIVERPVGSQVILSTPDQLTTGFQFAAGTPGVDIAGRYAVKATVVDDLETKSVNPCVVEFEAIPTDTFLVQLTWDTPSGDMDLHVAKVDGAGDFCISGNRGIDPQASGQYDGNVAEECSSGDDLDCNFSNCKAAYTSRPDWDEDGTLSDGDPSLDIDDVDGYGPENINVDQSSPGSYLISVFYYSGQTDVGNTVRIYVYGLLQQEHYYALRDDDWRDVAILHWQNLPAGEGEWCLEDLDDGDRSDDCGM
jgi:hypothetical protein